MASYSKPQVTLHQLFSAVSSNDTVPLYACIVGPQYDVHEYSTNSGADNSDIRAGSYNNAVDTAVSWSTLGKAAGTEVDQSWTKVYIEDALLKYFEDPLGDPSVIIAADTNKIRANDVVFKTANGYTRSAGLDRDVRVGDVVKLIHDTGSGIETMQSTVVGVEADTVNSSVESAVPVAGNAGNSTASVEITQTDGEVNDISATADGTNYDGSGDGHLSETYYIEVIQGSIGDDATTALLKVTSLSGTDDVASVTPSAFGFPTAIGTRGLTVTFDNYASTSSSSSPGSSYGDFIVGQKWTVSVSQTFTVASATSGGYYTGDNDKTYIIEVVKGGAWADNPQVKCYANDGSDASGPVTVSDDVAFAVGTEGVTMKLAGGSGLVYGDKYTIEVTAETDGAIKTLVLANTLPEAYRTGSPDLGLVLYVRQSEAILIPERDEIDGGCMVYYEQNAYEIILKAGWKLEHADFEDALDVEDGVVYVAHRDLNPVYANAVTFFDEDNMSSLGNPTPDNPLAYAVYKALQNSGGISVMALGLNGVDLSDWQAAVDILAKEEDAYSIVPLSQDTDVKNLFETHVETVSDEGHGYWRVVWLSDDIDNIQAVYTEENGSPLLATITDNPNQSGTQYTYVHCDDAQFITNGVRAGDILRANYTTDACGNQTYSEYTIDSVLSEETLILSSGPDSEISVASKVEIWREYTGSEFAEYVATFPGSHASRRVRWVYPSEVVDGSDTVSAQYLCAALAGLRSGVSPHQPLTNVEINGFTDVNYPVDLTQSQLDTIAGGGAWLVVKDPKSGMIYTRDALTTDMSDLNHKTESVCSNFDEISKRVWSAVVQYQGNTNVTDGLLRAIDTSVTAVLKWYKNTPYDDTIGPRVLDATITELAASDVAEDHIVLRISADLPYPFNGGDIYITI